MANPSSFSVNKFKEALAANGGPSRQNYFIANFTFSGISDGRFQKWNSDRLGEVICRSTTTPAYLVEPVTLKYFSREVKVPGARTYPPITLTFTNTMNNKVRELLFEWQSALSAPKSNVRGLYGDGTPKPTNIASRTSDTDERFIHSNAVFGIYEGLFADITLTHFDIKGKQGALLQTLDALSPIAGGIGKFFQNPQHTPIATYYLRYAFPTSIGGLTFTHDSDEIQTFDVEFAYQYMEYEFLKQAK